MLSLSILVRRMVYPAKQVDFAGPLAVAIGKKPGSPRLTLHAISVRSPCKFGRCAQYLYWGFVIFLAGLQVYANFGPPPSSPEFMTMTALFFYMSLTLLAAWVERIATAH
jgi:hypothetical protein